MPSALSPALVLGEKVLGFPTKIACSSEATGQFQSLSRLGSNGYGVCPPGGAMS